MAYPTYVADVVAVLSGQRKVYYGWWLLAASVAAMALGSGVSFWTYGLYVEPLEAEFGWSRAQVSLGFSASLLTGGIAGPLVGRWVDRRGPRAAILVGAALTGLSYGLLAATQELWQWYALWAVNGMARQLMFFIPFMTLVSRWFDRHRGIAVSILGTGFSLGGFIFLPIMGQVVDALGWRGGFAFSAIAIPAVFIPIALLLIRDAPRHLEGGDEIPTEVTGVPLRRALRTPLFWVLASALTLFFYGLFGWLVHQIPFYESQGISNQDAASIVAIAAGCSIFARLGAGVIADHFTRFEPVVMALCAFLMGGMATLLIAPSTAGITLFVLLWVIGSSGGPMIEALLLTRAFGVAHFASILGAILVVETVGQIISPTIAGAIYDATGSYDWALVMFLGTFAGSFVLFGVALRLPRPEFIPVVSMAPPSTTLIPSPSTREGKDGGRA